jgi:hypothetical protein
MVSTDRVYADKPGFYAVRMARGAVEVACKVSHGPTCDPETGEPLDRSWHWTIEINGKVAHSGPGVWERLLVGRPIDEAEYRFLLADRQWASEFAPSSPEANPSRRVDSASIPMPF